MSSVVTIVYVRNELEENWEEVAEEIMEAIEILSSPEKKKKMKKRRSSSHGFFYHGDFDRTETMEDSAAECEREKMQNEVVTLNEQVMSERKQKKKKKKKKYLRSEEEIGDFEKQRTETQSVESTKLQEEEIAPVHLKKKKKKKKDLGVGDIELNEDSKKQRVGTLSVENMEIQEEEIVSVPIKKKKKKKKEKHAENVRECDEKSETSVNPNPRVVDETFEGTEHHSSKTKKKKKKDKKIDENPERHEEGFVSPNSPDPDSQSIPVSAEKKKKKKTKKEGDDVPITLPEPAEMEIDRKKKKKRIKAETEESNHNFENVEHVTEGSEMVREITRRRKKKKRKMKKLEDHDNQENMEDCVVVSRKKKRRKESESVSGIFQNGEKEDSLSPCYPSSITPVRKTALTSIETPKHSTSGNISENRQKSGNTKSPFKNRKSTHKVFLTPQSDRNTECGIKSYGAKNLEASYCRKTESQNKVRGLLAAFGQNPTKHNPSESKEHSRVKFSDSLSDINDTNTQRHTPQKRRIFPDNSSDSDTSCDISPPKIPKTSLLTSHNGKSRGKLDSAVKLEPVPKGEARRPVPDLVPTFPIVRSELEKTVTSQSPSTSQTSLKSPRASTMTSQSPLLTSEGSVASLLSKRWCNDPLRPMPDRRHWTTPPDSAHLNRFSPDEDLVLRANWASFCARVAGEVEDPSSLILEPSTLGTRRLDVIREYRLYASLQRGLSKNKYQCYSRLQLLLEEEEVVERRGKLSGDELRQLARLLRQHGADWRLIGRQLRRSARSVKNQARKHWENVSKPGRRVGSWTADEDEQLIRAVRQQSGLEDLAGLGAEAAAKLDWAKVSAAHGSRTRDQCWHQWTDRLSYRVRGIEPRPPSQEETDLLLELLAASDVSSFSHVPWARIGREFPDTVPVSQLRKRAVTLRRRVPDYKQLTWAQCLARMRDDCKPKPRRRRPRITDTSPDRDDL